MDWLDKQKHRRRIKLNVFSGMPNMSDLPVDTRKEYLMLVASIASSDGTLDPKENSLLKRWIKDFELDESQGKKIMDIAQQEELGNRDKIEKRMSDSGLTVSLMLDLMGMAMADGVLADEEIDLLRSVSQSLDMPATDFNIYLEFVHSAHQQATLPSPEPLFDHNIETAFKMMKSKNIQLYAHTLLCATHPGYDQELKIRWNKTKA